MGKRVLSTVVLWSLLFVVLWLFRNPGAAAVVALMSALTLREFYRLQTAASRAPFPLMGMAFGALITLAPWLELHIGRPAHVVLTVAVLLFALRILSERPPEQRGDALGSTLFGLVYVAMLLQYLVRILTPLPGDVITPDGRLVLGLWVVAVAKLCDTGALLTGMAFGKHAMAPTISPKKTWEGAVGGVLVAAAVGGGIAWAGQRALGPAFPPLRLALYAVPVAMIAIISDLIESILKRQATSKDSGHAIPGIGGVFDLTDSLLLASPLAYFLFGLP